ncbi:MAG TPA: PP2C family serine/threonine-protein phosphatase [Pyrinomonadaceae bacterium]|nr:PP2C family serine/threonine-protein phosphatase [Pyrinomonadaceae bacterium]
MSDSDSDMQPARSMKLYSSTVTDRGLNEKRPLNEDSYLADSERGIFSVADGVGGAEAGEVASQTAIEVLDEAFRHRLDGADIEDLMELAIQRANQSIHQMAQEHAKFSMMATTIVALHVKGNVATFGHVGDSRLYRLTPSGQLLRETLDHSVVEEEVRAGRMTPEQAANHPSKNVISRALGAEEDVEVDLKTIEVEDGTQFLLCTDGITRHIPDHELRHLLITHDELPALCEELKRRCYERGAEDNLTAVVVSVGKPILADDRVEDLEKTISPETMPLPIADAQTVVGATPDAAGFVPASRIAFPAGVTTSDEDTVSPDTRTASAYENKLNVASLAGPPPQPQPSGIERMMKRFFVFVVFLGIVAAAFYAGRKYSGPIPYLAPAAIPEASPTPVVGDDPILVFERSRREVDNDPNAWLATHLNGELATEKIAQPLDSKDGKFLYLYGRASMLTGNHDEAVKAFEAAASRTNLVSPQENATIKREAALALAALALNSEKDRPAAQARLDENIKPTPSPAASPSSPSPSP